jgi:hypothetical protein
MCCSKRIFVYQHLTTPRYSVVYRRTGSDLNGTIVPQCQCGCVHSPYLHCEINGLSVILYTWSTCVVRWRCVCCIPVFSAGKYYEPPTVKSISHHHMWPSGLKSNGFGSRSRVSPAVLVSRDRGLICGAIAGLLPRCQWVNRNIDASLKEPLLYSIYVMG